MTAKLGYVLDDIFVQHRAPSGHPERPARAEAVRDALIAAGIEARGVRIAPRFATDDELARVHAAGYLEDLARVVPGNAGWLDPDTYYSPGTWDAARAAVGSVCELATDVLHGALGQGIAVVRPPGHHATRDQAMGFCLLNNVAAAAAAARAAGAARVAVVDWDVHHGNGTQSAFYERDDVLFFSAHRFPFYPGTGALEEAGRGKGEGFTVNAPLPPRLGDDDYAALFRELLVPIADAWRPDLVLVSAGFDPHEDDPLGGMAVTPEGFARLCSIVGQIADRHAGGKLALVLEGGYDLSGLAGSVSACIEVLAGARVPEAGPPSPRGRQAIDRAIDFHSRYWPSLR